MTHLLLLHTQTYHHMASSLSLSLTLILSSPLIRATALLAVAGLHLLLAADPARAHEQMCEYTFSNLVAHVLDPASAFGGT